MYMICRNLLISKIMLKLKKIIVIKKDLNVYKEPIYLLISNFITPICPKQISWQGASLHPFGV